MFYSLSYGKLLLSFSGELIQNIPVQSDISIILFTLALVLNAVIFVFYRKKANLILKALFLQRYFSQLIREGKLLNERIVLLITPMFFILQTILLFTVLQFFFTDLVANIQLYQLYIILFIVVVVHYFIKIFFIFSHTALFDHKQDRVYYYLNKLFFNFSSVIPLFFILPFSVFLNNKYVLFIYLAIFVLNFIFYTIRIFMLNAERDNLFRFFVYFCTLEILPYFIVVKLLLRYWN